MSNDIVLKGINKYYSSNHVLKDIDLVIKEGEFMTLLGPSGCGKTTTLRVIAGLERPQTGTISIGDKLIVNAKENFFLEPGKRDMNLVFQSYALWPHMTVFDNVAFGLKVKKLAKDEIKNKVEAALDKMKIKEFSDRYPSELSGGQQQRVAIARAIVSDAKVLLLDEPLSNLDAKLRIEMRAEIKRLHHDLGTTIIYVTHDQVEALTMSSKIAIFFEGVLEQVASPMELYQNPASIRVADFIGNPKINMIAGKARIDEHGNAAVCSDLGDFVFRKENFTEHMAESGTDFDCVVGIRPEKISISKSPVDGAIKAKVYASQPAGSETTVVLHLGSSEVLAKEIGIKHYTMDSDVYLSIENDKANLFDGKSGWLVPKAILD